MVNSVELMQFCRLCLVKDQVNIPIFEEQGDVHQIFLKISACLPVKVSREDNLPKKICGDCSYKLDLFYQFWNTSANSEKQLLAWLNEIGLNQDALGDVGLQKPESTAQVPTNIILKQEAIEPEPDPPNDGPGNIVSNETQDYILQQQQLPYQASTFPFSNDGNFGAAEASTASGTSNAVANNTREASLKRKRQATATVTQPESEEDDDDDGVDAVETKVAKTEETSDDDRDDDGLEDQESTSFAGMPSTSTDNEQPGPSGMGKNVNEAPNKFSQVFWIIKSNANEIPTCSICSKTFVTKGDLNRHMRVHSNIRPFKCNLCDKSFKSNYERKVHEIVHKTFKEDDLLPCFMCTKKFRSKSELEKHKRRHLKDYKHTCSMCGKGCYTKTELRSHTESIHEGMIYTCEICEKPFKSMTSLKFHMKSHDKKPFLSPKTFNCKYCDKCYLSKVSLNRHLEIHEGKQRVTYICAICGKNLTSRFSLKNHMLLHEHVKPFKCDYCGKCFTNVSNLKCHRRTHNGIKPFKCDQCDKKFSQKSPLIIHKRIHSGERPYKCELCENTFISKSALNMHKANRHQIVKKEKKNIS